MAYSIERLPERISIGRETETGVTDVMTDCGAWIRKWPGMALHAIHTPDGGAPYILQTETDGSVLVWHVTDADTATPGTGLVEIVGETDGRRKVSATVKVSVAARMSGTVGEPPDAAKPWADRVVEASERITGMKVQAATLATGSGATAAWDGEQGLLTIGVPKGDQGPKGEPGKEVVVDTTLTKEGQAADAKVTGDTFIQIKDDLSDKLPKSPANWEPWTAEQQAAARDRMGIPGDYVLIEEITLEEDVGSISRSKEPDGTPYSFSAFCIIAEINILDSDTSSHMRIDASSKVTTNLFLEYFSRSSIKNKRIHVNYEALSPNLFRLSSEINDKGRVLFTQGHVSVRNLAYGDSPILSTTVNYISIKNITLCAGTTIKIYGVRA